MPADRRQQLAAAAAGFSKPAAAAACADFGTPSVRAASRSLLVRNGPWFCPAARWVYDANGEPRRQARCLSHGENQLFSRSYWTNSHRELTLKTTMNQSPAISPAGAWFLGTTRFSTNP